MLTQDELFGQLRQHHVVGFDEVKRAKLEGNGRLSVLFKKRISR
jgi:uncharacterized membrane protein YcaP (DUF421 family)